MTPASGYVTDFSDYSTATGKWGSTSGLYGMVYSYSSSNATMTAVVDTSNKNLHITGTLASGDYAGAGLSFAVCATVVTFNSISFTLAGSAPGCNLYTTTSNLRPTSQQPEPAWWL